MLHLIWERFESNLHHWAICQSQVPPHPLRFTFQFWFLTYFHLLLFFFCASTKQKFSAKWISHSSEMLEKRAPPQPAAKSWLLASLPPSAAHNRRSNVTISLLATSSSSQFPPFHNFAHTFNLISLWERTWSSISIQNHKCYIAVERQAEKTFPNCLLTFLKTFLDQKNPPPPLPLSHTRTLARKLPPGQFLTGLLLVVLPEPVPAPK